MTYDLIIIGGGPAGYTAAERAARGGLDTLLIEERALGGVCLNEGCIPTKTLLYSAKVWQTVQSAAKYGVTCTPEQIDPAKVISRKNKVVRKLVAGIRSRMKEAGVTVVTEHATVTGHNSDDTYTVTAATETYTAKHLLLCTGSETVIPPIPGVEEGHYITHREALDSKELPASIVIIGGGVIGMEFAAYYNEMGVTVSVVEMLPEIINGMDSELAALLREEYAKRGIKFYLQHKVTHLYADGVEVEYEGKTFKVEGEQVMLSVGRRPVTSSFEALLSQGLELERRGVKTDEYLRTSLPNLYAAGDVNGHSLLAHTAVREAEVAVDHILGRKINPMSYRAIPGVVYTHPEIAGVGFTEDALRSGDKVYTKLMLPMSYSGRFVAENEMASGFCKVLVNPEGKILGVHMLGNPCSELIVTAGLAIERGMTAHELSEIIFPHPSVAEILKETLETFPRTN